MTNSTVNPPKSGLYSDYCEVKRLFGLMFTSVYGITAKFGFRQMLYKPQCGLIVSERNGVRVCITGRILCLTSCARRLTSFQGVVLGYSCGKKRRKKRVFRSAEETVSSQISFLHWNRCRHASPPTLQMNKSPRVGGA